MDHSQTLCPLVFSINVSSRCTWLDVGIMLSCMVQLFNSGVITLFGIDNQLGMIV